MPLSRLKHLCRPGRLGAADHGKTRRVALNSLRTKTLVTRLDAGSFASLMGRLLGAEAKKQGVKAGGFRASDELTDPDGGLDAIVEGVPEEADHTFLETGTNGFQFKTTGKSPAALKVATELIKPGPTNVLVRGGRYVMCSNQDLNPGQATAIENAVTAEASAALAKAGSKSLPRTSVWDANAVARLCEAHPSAADELGLADFEVAMSLEELRGRLRTPNRPFQTDDPRNDAIARLRQRVAEAERTIRC